MPETFSPAAIVAAILIFFTLISYFFRFLSKGGIILANATGILAFALGGIVPFATLLVFYALAEFATWIGRKDAAKHEQRTYSNIFGNCTAAIAALFFGQHLAFFGAISAAFADTVSSEIGLLSKKRPVLITNFQPVEKGTDGAISALGCAASLIAAAIIGAVYYFFVSGSLKLFVIVVVSGFLGGLFDSFLGATLQRRGLIGNTHVNFLAGVFGAMVAIALAGFL